MVYLTREVPLFVYLTMKERNSKCQCLGIILLYIGEEKWNVEKEKVRADKAYLKHSLHCVKRFQVHSAIEGLY